MSPVERSSFRAGRTMIMSLVVIAIAVAVLWGASVLLTNRHNARVVTDSGGKVELGKSSKLVAQFERGGDIPMYFPDVSGNAQRAVYLTHAGGHAAKGWSAFLAQVPGETSSCQWTWNRSDRRFDASCDPNRHADARGTGLVHYPVEVVRGKVQVDLGKGTRTSTAAG